MKLYTAAYGVGKQAFKEYRATLPKDFNVVAEGGWYALQKKYGTFIVTYCTLHTFTSVRVAAKVFLKHTLS